MMLFCLRNESINDHFITYLKTYDTLLFPELPFNNPVRHVVFQICIPNLSILIYLRKPQGLTGKPKANSNIQSRDDKLYY